MFLLNVGHQVKLGTGFRKVKEDRRRVVSEFTAGPRVYDPQHLHRQETLLRLTEPRSGPGKTNFGLQVKIHFENRLGVSGQHLFQMMG